MYQNSYLVEQVLLSQFEWKSRDSSTETWLTDRYRSLSFVTTANFPCAVAIRRMANDITYTMYAALPIHYVYNLWCVQAIEGYRETERERWREENVSVIQRLRETAELAGGERVAALDEVHVLDLAKDG